MYHYKCQYQRLKCSIPIMLVYICTSALNHPISYGKPSNKMGHGFHNKLLKYRRVIIPVIADLYI